MTAVQHAARIRSVQARVATCSPDEVRVLDYVLGRLELGRERYGLLNLSRDTRDWNEEERQEHADAVVYRACAELVRLDRVHADLRTAAGIEMVENGLAELRDAQPATVVHPPNCQCRVCFENWRAQQVEDDAGDDVGGEAG